MTDKRRTSFGIKTSQAGIGYAEILAAWREADAIGVFEHAWLWDHMIPLRGPAHSPALEGWTLLAALAAQTTRLRLGVMVTSNRLRSPAVLAKMAATVDVISGGRLDFGIGAGGCLLPGAPEDLMAIVRREFGAYGVPIVPAADAIRALDEACALIKRMWSEPEPFDFDGRYYTLRGAICEPKPVQRPGPPVVIGGAGETLTLRVVARHADIWNCPARTAPDLKRASAILDEHCAAIGRDPREIVRSRQILVAPDGAAQARAAVAESIDAGFTHIVLAPLPPFRPVAWLADEVVAPVLSGAG